ncbi:MAG: FHA domain-containing protein [Planctomycetota bacterium]
MQYEFTLIDPDSGKELQRYVLPLPVTVGRGMLCHISVDHGSISRKHCEFYHDEDGALSVRDMGSKNGVFVGGDRVDKSVVEVDTVVRLGLQLIRVRDANGSASESASPTNPSRAAQATDQDETHAVRILPDDGRYEIG